MTKFNDAPKTEVEKTLMDMPEIQEMMSTLAALHRTAKQLGDLDEEGAFLMQSRLTNPTTGEQLAYEITVKEIEP